MGWNDFHKSDNAIFGGADDDVLSGRAGGESLFGGDGEDALYGDKGSDQLQNAYRNGRNWLSPVIGICLVLSMAAQGTPDLKGMT